MKNENNELAGIPGKVTIKQCGQGMEESRVIR